MIREDDLHTAFPADTEVPAAQVAASFAASGQVLVVLDDDPTGTQSVAGLPVLTRWEVDDFTWAFATPDPGRPAPAVYVLTNTRSLDPDEAARRNREVVTNALAAAQGSRAVTFVSRSDSTLRGHFPLEPDTIAATVQELTGRTTDGVVVVPAFPDAGRITVGGTHYARGTDGALTPVADTEFARDATFGYRTSVLADWVEEKSAGRHRASTVLGIDLRVLRTGSPDQSAVAIADVLDGATDRTPVVVDAVTENDLRRLALGLAEAERRGRSFIHRVGPPFVRARIGQEVAAPLTAEVIPTPPDATAGGLIVVGSHVGQTTRQLEALRRRHSRLRVAELDVQRLLAGAGDPVAETAQRISADLGAGDVVLHTSRTLVTAGNPAGSLAIARQVSAALVAIVQRVVADRRPRFVIAKGGITSSDVAAHGLGIVRAIVRGPMLPGIVSLWEPADGPARGVPYVVFAGNVGDDEALAVVVATLSTTIEPSSTADDADLSDPDPHPHPHQE
ncbi:four-carbon acid sugar kinase family protein [Tersicoccus sp. Bi-70]|uniref:four-carbon acid sugar kinase family protein n=1 Tax=Tersicoccus sp. Bi-70 TaxID=1897634 RepID=UPI00117C8136|nr:four-carbon acid sugar kinase family protein [Tersicoccus sp. Bi-70]